MGKNGRHKLRMKEVKVIERPTAELFDEDLNKLYKLNWEVESGGLATFHTTYGYKKHYWAILTRDDCKE